MKDATVVTLCSMACVTFLAALYDGNLLYIAVGALVGLLAPSPLQGSARVETPTDRAERDPIGG